MKTITLGKLQIANNLPFALLAGPCVLESRDHAFMMCGALKELTTKLGIPFIYKTSFDKANRTSVKAERGMGIDAAMKIFQDIKKELDVPVVTDVHAPEQCAIVAEAVDVLQIRVPVPPDGFAAGRREYGLGKVVNVKKGQFLAPWDMKNVADKIASTGNDNIMLCERGVTFGYNTLVNDMRALPIMAETGYPVVFDATHSVQSPGGKGNATGGDRKMVPPLSRAAVAIGVAAVFMETHQDPDNAPSDGPNMVKLNDMEGVLRTMMQIDEIAKNVSA